MTGKKKTKAVLYPEAEFEASMKCTSCAELVLRTWAGSR